MKLTLTLCWRIFTTIWFPSFWGQKKITIISSHFYSLLYSSTKFIVLLWYDLIPAMMLCSKSILVTHSTEYRIQLYTSAHLLSADKTTIVLVAKKMLQHLPTFCLWVINFLPKEPAVFLTTDVHRNSWLQAWLISDGAMLLMRLSIIYTDTEYTW